MNKKLFNESVGKMLSLMDRMNGNMTPYEAVLNEQERINEALESNRTLVQANNLYDVITNMDAGGFASFGYVVGVDLPKVQKINPATNRKKGYLDKETLSSKVNYPAEQIGGIIKFTRYLVNWSTPESINKKYSDFKDSHNSICDKIGREDLRIGDRKKTQTKQEYGKHGVSVYTGDDESKKEHEYSNQNIHGAKVKSTYYLIDINGNVIREVEKSEISDILIKKTPTNYVERLRNALSELGQEDAEIKSEIDNLESMNLQRQSFLLHSIMYIVGATKDENGQTKKIIFLNDALKDVFGDVKVNTNQLRDIEREKRNIDMQDVVNSTENKF